MRTDRTFVCTDCRVRSWPVRRCPACGGTRGLVDLEQSPDGIERGPRPRERREDGSVALTSSGIVGVVGSIGAIFGGHVGLGELGLLVSLPLFFAGLVTWPRNARRVVPGELRYRVLDSPVVRARARRTRHTGTVRARATLNAPLSGRECVAWRLWGETPLGAIDDAASTTFFVVVGGGTPDVEVDGSVASIDLPMPSSERAPLRSVDETLATWLCARGVREPSGLAVREAVLLAGDPVEVVGTARQESSADGYRGSRAREVLADLPGSPLIVRSPPSPPEGETASNA